MDFSGDDGAPGTAGTSPCLCAAWVISAESDVRHNEGVLLRIKRAIGCNPNDEIKYRSLKRHPKKSQALDLLTSLSASVMLVPVLKDRITDSGLRDPKTKRLVSLIHYFPLLSTLHDHFVETTPDVYFQLVFDQIAWAQSQKDVEEHFRNDKGLDWKTARPDWLRFAKSGGQPMLQIADIIAGLGRDYLESRGGQRRPPCDVCWVKGKTPCTFSRNRQGVGRMKLLRLIHPLLLRKKGGDVWDRGFVVHPREASKEFLFIDCLFRV